MHKLPLSDVAGKAELWEVVTGKDGTRYENMERCNSLVQFEEENKELSEFLAKQLEDWLKQDPKKNQELLEKLGKGGGFSYKHTDGYTYKMVKFKGQLQLTRIKSGSGSWGGKKGQFTFLRTGVFKEARAEDVAKIINNQEPGDNWKITFLYQDKLGNMYQMENQEKYTPGAAAASAGEAKKDISKEEDEEEDQE